ncbi:MAG: polyphosphate polymerase domain-containing protein [Lachnospiraceae bacterium]|nr:polyphosphate polymerase domain-containing protein [Lachnospiraceae bacterium]
MAQTVFNRVEKKYKLSEEKYEAFIEDLLNYMDVDEYGKHTISNIYYDTPDNLLIMRSIQKPNPMYKEKLRLRAYGTPTLDTKCFLEIKKKYDGIVNKRRIQLPLKAAYDYIDNGVKPFEQTQILSELDYFLSIYDLKPQYLVAYERIALFGKEDPSFRVTFDTNIRYRTEDVRLEAGNHGHLIFDDNTHLMEVKVTGGTPIWFSKLLSKHSAFTNRFSKIASSYTMHQAVLKGIEGAKEGEMFSAD